MIELNEKLYKAAYENNLKEVQKLLTEQEELQKSIEKIEKIIRKAY